MQVKEAVKTIDHSAVAWRDTNRERGRSQNDVMGRSAIDEFKTFADEHEGELSDTHIQVFQKAEKVRAVNFLRDRYKNQDRTEWLHRIANSVHAKSEDPQTKDNLAAAPKYINTKMMLTERTIKDVCLHDQDTIVTEHTRFELFWGSDILLRGFIKADFVHEPTKNAVMIHQHLNPWIKYPRIHRSTDIAQTALVTRSLLADVQGYDTTITRPLSKHYHPSGIVRTPVVGASSAVTQQLATPIPATPAGQLIAKVEQTTHGIVLSLPNGQRLNVQLSPAAVSHSARTLHASEEDGDTLSDFDDDSENDNDYEKDDGFIASEEEDDEIIHAPKSRMRQLKRTDLDEESDDDDSEHESGLRASYSDDDSASESDEQESDLSSDESGDESDNELSESDLVIKEITFAEAKAKIDQSMKSLKAMAKTPQQQQSFGFYRAEVNSLLRGYNERKGTDDEQTLADLVQKHASIYSNYRAQIKELGRLENIRPGATSFTRARLDNVIDKYEELVSTDNSTAESRRSRRLQST